MDKFNSDLLELAKLGATRAASVDSDGAETGKLMAGISGVIEGFDGLPYKSKTLIACLTAVFGTTKYTSIKEGEK